jgi:hypothetical protein
VWWGLGLAFGLFAAVKFAAVGWCMLELHRKWRSIPELWGLDWLDIVCRLERTYGVLVTAADFAALSPDARWGLTAGRLWEVVTARLRAVNAPIPADGWERIVTVLSEALNVKPERIAPESRLSADLGMWYGLD